MRAAGRSVRSPARKVAASPGHSEFPDRELA
jgi:hypothetical protein